MDLFTTDPIELSRALTHDGATPSECLVCRITEALARGDTPALIDALEDAFVTICLEGGVYE